MTVSANLSLATPLASASMLPRSPAWLQQVSRRVEIAIHAYRMSSVGAPWVTPRGLKWPPALVQPVFKHWPRQYKHYLNRTLSVVAKLVNVEAVGPRTKAADFSFDDHGAVSLAVDDLVSITVRQ